jgi:pyruvate formate lyase activating enzyme
MTSTGSVHSWDISTGVDGPGSRFVLFLAGCPLRCLYCQNPDTWRMRDGTTTSVTEVMERILRYQPIFARTGGGVTISGGEPLLQPAFVEDIFAQCAAAGIHTALDTSGALGSRAADSLLDSTKLVLLDIKSFDRAVYTRTTGGGNVAPTLRFAERLAFREVPVWVRFVVVPGLTDGAHNVAQLAEFVAGLPNVERVDVIGVHRLGEPKYEALGIPFPLADVASPTADQLERIRLVFRDQGLVVT